MVGGFYMASKGQKFNRYSPELKEEILNQYKKYGIGSHQLSREYGIPRGTIERWILQIQHPELIKTNGRGRPKNKDLTLEDYKERYEILKKYQAFLKARHEKK